jgi:hypothetical protein
MRVMTLAHIVVSLGLSGSAVGLALIILVAATP